jgi:membrane protease YdiL (CAAX protease family)
MKKIIISSAALAMPFFALAAGLEDILETVKNLADAIVPLFMVIAVAVFLWGIIRYITSAGDEEKQKASRGYIIYGLIGIFVMISFWGIIQVVATSFSIGTAPGQITAPKLP